MRRRLIAASVATLFALGAGLFAFLPSARTAGNSKFALGYVEIANAGIFSLTVFNPTNDVITVTFDMRDRSGYVAAFPDTFEIAAGGRASTGYPCTVATCDGFPTITSPTPKVVLSADWTPFGQTVRQFANAGDWKKIS